MITMRKRALALVLAALTSGPARAHEGPPYPVIVDQVVGPYTLSLWADPDVGTGSFFVTFDPPAYQSDEDPRVAIEVWPSSGRLDPARHDAVLQRDRTYFASVPFDREESWQARVLVLGSRGSGDVVVEVAVTPPGYGRWDLLIYGTPFLLLGGLWAIVAIRKHKDRREQRS